MVLANLSGLQVQAERLGEQVLAQLWELAGAVLQDAAGDSETLTGILLALQTDAESPGKGRHSEGFPEYRELMTRMTVHGGVTARLVLYHFLDVLAPAGRMTFQPLRKVSPSVRGRVSYMTGSLADKAFLQFSERLPGCRAADVRSFVDACEEVYNGLCQFCILPLESAEEGRLSAFFRLIVRYGLQTVAVCDVMQKGVGGLRRTRFALLCAGDGEPTFRYCPQDASPRYIELIHTSCIMPSITEVLTVADFCGMRLIRADTLSAADEAALSRGREEDADELSAEKTRPVNLLFDTCPSGDDRAAALSVFLRWLTLEAGDDIVTGCYP